MKNITVNSKTNFNSLKNHKLSRFEAYFDLITNFPEEFKTTTPQLAIRWNWKHHSRVINFLKHLEKKGEIIKNSSNKNTVIRIIDNTNRKFVSA